MSTPVSDFWSFGLVTGVPCNVSEEGCESRISICFKNIATPVSQTEYIGNNEIQNSCDPNWKKNIFITIQNCQNQFVTHASEFLYGFHNYGKWKELYLLNLNNIFKTEVYKYLQDLFSTRFDTEWPCTCHLKCDCPECRFF